MTDQRASRQGFALALCIVAVALLSSLAVGVMLSARASIRDVDYALSRAQGRALVTAATNRVMWAMAFGGRRFESWYPDAGGTTEWKFDGRRVFLSIEAESAKVDLNAAPRTLIEAFLEPEPTDLRTQAEEGIDQFRGHEKAIPAVGAVLSPCLRLAGATVDLEKRFTVYTRGAGIDPRSLDDDGMARFRKAISLSSADALSDPPNDAVGVEGLLSTETGVHTISVRAQVNDRVTFAQRTVIYVEGRPANVHIVRTESFGEAATDVCR